MKIRDLLDENDEEFYAFELALVGPKSPGSLNKIGMFELPSHLATINWNLVRNPEYIARAGIFDMTNDTVALSSISKLKNIFITKKIEYCELVIVVTAKEWTEIHDSYWGGQKVPNGPKHRETNRELEYVRTYIKIEHDTMKLNDINGYEIFTEYENTIADKFFNTLNFGDFF